MSNPERKGRINGYYYGYKIAFSLRHEISTCPNIEVEIDVVDMMPFFIRPYHVKEKDKQILDKEIKRLCHLCILKEGFPAYSSTTMLISIKLLKDNRVCSDFRHINTRIAKPV